MLDICQKRLILLAVPLDKFYTHQVMLHAPAQVDGHVIIGVDLVHRQMLLPDGLQMPGSIVHIAYGVPVRKGTAGSGILTVRLRHKADAVHFIQQGVRVVGQFVLQLVPVEGEHLVEVDLLAARQGADLAAVLRPLGGRENGGAQLRVLCKVLLIVHGMAETQPSIAGNGQSGLGFQQADGPVPPLILQILMLQLPVPRQRDGQLRPLQLVFRQRPRHIHPVGAHAHGDQGVVVPLLGGRHHADVHMDVRGRQLMEHMPKLAEILLDVPLDGRQFLLRIDLGNTGFLILGGFTVRAVLAVIIRTASR